jgi:hypothetical protein
MKQPNIQKRCQNCDCTFLIENARESHFREILLLYTPCPHCGFTAPIHYPRYERDGSCNSCHLAFTLVFFKGNGKCERCYKAALRDKHRSFGSV